MEQQTKFSLCGKEYSYIDDHRVNDSVVVPGALFLAWAAQREASLSDIKFLQMVPVSNGDDLSFKLGECNAGYSTFTQAGADAPCVQFKTSQLKNVGIQITTPELAVLRQVDQSTLYNALDSGGNSYGTCFQGIQNAVVTAETVTAAWRAPQDVSGTSRLVTLIDSFTHALSLVSDRHSVYYLDSISELSVVDSNIPEHVEVRVQLMGRHGNSVNANIVAVDTEGKCLLSTTGLSISYQSQPVVSVALAGTFNIDPLLPVLDMWGRRLDVSVQKNVVDYGQLIPSLIEQGGALDSDSHSQTCFIRLQDWGQTAENQYRKVNVDYKIQDEDLTTYTLPDTRVVASLNQYETSYLYKEIFLDQTYKRHNVLLSDNDTVIDIGANIGLFSMFASEQAENVRVIAVEPSPSVLPFLRSNLAAHTSSHTVVAAGASDSRGEAEFTAYQKSSVFSGFMANENDDRSAIKTIICNMLSAAGELDAQELDNAAEEMLKDRMLAEQYVCPLISVSDIIDEQQLDKVSLLKIDAEKSEEAILKGIRSEHWSLIEQIIIEVHKQSGIGVEGARHLLEQKGFDCIEDEEQFLSDSGLVTIYAVKPARREKNTASLPATKIERSVELFLGAIEGFISSNRAKDLEVVVCPSLVMDPALSDCIHMQEKLIAKTLHSETAVKVFDWSDWCVQYPVESPHDLVSDSAGHIPYTKEWYAGTATTLLRKNMFKIRKPRKAVIFDCDNTLWNGVVGEDSVEGVDFQTHNLELQKFAKELSQNGYLLCLASKNDEDIVKQVFNQRSVDMILSMEDMVSTRINWTNKPENLISLSEELNIGLDSFVFFDDSPVECEQMRKSLPQVLTIQFNEQVGTASYLANIWDLDCYSSTEEDKNRTQLYAQESSRQEQRSKFNDVEDFVNSIDLNVRTELVNDGSVARASQMCMRTNQFNFTSMRYTESDIRSLMAEDSTFVETIRVTDTFGDYGITGLLVYRHMAESLVVDTFLLSCRVLGRSVEHHVAAYLGSKAIALCCENVTYRFASTGRNSPAAIFLESMIGSPLVAPADKTDYEFKSSVMRDVRFKSVKKVNSEPSMANGNEEAVGYSVSVPVVHFIASEMVSASAIVGALDSRSRLPRPKLASEYVAAESDVQKQLVSLWEELLGIDGIGVEDNFFRLGGTSLKGVEMVSRVMRDFGLKVNVAQLFENPTIALLAETASGRGGLTLKPRSVKSKGKGRRKPAKRRDVQLALRGADNDNKKVVGN